MAGKETTAMQLQKLTKLMIKSELRKPESERRRKLLDGGGLELRIGKGSNPSASWVFVYRLNGKRPEIGIGSLQDVSLAEARRISEQGRAWLAATPKKDPRIEWARLEKEAIDAARAARESLTLGEWIEIDAPREAEKLSNEKNKKALPRILRRHFAPILHMKLDEITRHDVRDCLAPKWKSMNPQMARARRLLENALENAMVWEAMKERDNPAALAKVGRMLPKRSRDDSARQHFETHHFKDMPDFMTRLRERKALSARALEFSILTAARASMVRGATWDEVDLDCGLWSISGERMKMRRNHVVPLSMQALALIRTFPHRTGYIFRSEQSINKCMSENAMSNLLRLRMNEVNEKTGKFVTQHAMARSAFKDWALELGRYDDQLSSFALAHVPDSLWATYRRGTAIDDRRAMMQHWADFLDAPAR